MSGVMAEDDTPEAAVLQKLAIKTGRSYRVDKVLWSRKEKGVMEVSLELVVPQTCRCCGAVKEAKIIKNTAMARVVKRNMSWKVISTEFRIAKGKTKRKETKN